MSPSWAPEYPCLAADPPWNETGGGKCKRGADRHYPLIKKREDILRVMVQAPCWRPAANSHLWLWVTNNFLPDGLWLMGALGFRYVTNRAWAKVQPAQCDRHLIRAMFAAEPPRPLPCAIHAWTPQRPGLGQYLRGQHELLLFGVRGRLPAQWKSEAWRAARPPEDAKAPGTLLLAPRREHSEKPQQAYDEIEHVTPGPRLEMFARAPRAGWDVWGDEVA